MISVYRWDAGTKADAWLTCDALQKNPDELLANGVVWIDLDHPTEEEEALVCQQFYPIHPLTLDDITKLRQYPDDPPHFPKVEEFHDYLFVVSNPLAPRFLDHVQGKADFAGDRRSATQLSALLMKKLLITHHYEPVRAIEQLRGHLDKHRTQAERGPGYLLHLILDAMVDQYAPALDHFDESLEEIEAQIFDKPAQGQLTQLLEVKREIITMRKTVVHEREVLARLARGEFDLIEDRETVYYRNVYDHLVRFTELLESSREMVSDLMHTHMAATEAKLNEVMKVLTMISTLVLPMTLIAGIYGMNFEEMPELRWAYGYPVALGLMLLSAVASLAFFRWRKWI